MKTLSIVLAAAFVSVLAGCGSASNDGATADDESDVTSDPCKAKALTAAETAYGNDPSGTSVKTLTKSKKYVVTVGKNNGEDGPEDFYVTFASSCSSKAVATPVPFFPSPLRDATHTAYTKIFNGDGNEIPASYKTTVSSLPSASHTQYEAYEKEVPGACTAVNAYKVTVSGQDTFAVECEVTADSIARDIAIYDSSGGDIDQCSIYHTSDVGTNGVTWQNETFEQSF